MKLQAIRINLRFPELAVVLASSSLIVKSMAFKLAGIVFLLSARANCQPGPYEGLEVVIHTPSSLDRGLKRKPVAVLRFVGLQGWGALEPVVFRETF